MKITMMVATHKRYQMPEDAMYLPVHCGHFGKEDIGYQGDDTGEHISDQNAYFCESSGVYWMWKNFETDYYGVCHYRRHFTIKPYPFFKQGKWEDVLTREQAESLLRRADVVVPNKRNYWIETNEGHYAHSSQFRPAELKLMRELLKEQGDSRYIQAFETVLQRRWAHMFNMLIMKRELFQDFNEWQFPLLFAFTQRLNRSAYPKKEDRAWITELMLDTWLEANQIPYVECPVMFMEEQNWGKKIGNMIARKFGKRDDFA